MPAGSGLRWSVLGARPYKVHLIRCAWSGLAYGVAVALRRDCAIWM